MITDYPYLWKKECRAAMLLFIRLFCDKFNDVAETFLKGAVLDRFLLSLIPLQSCEVDDESMSLTIALCDGFFTFCVIARGNREARLE